MLILDHIVHYVDRIEPILTHRIFSKLPVLPGGRHQGRPTFNHLLHFGHSYIEFLSIEDKVKLEEMESMKNSMIDNVIESGYREGFVRFVLQTNEIDKVKLDLARLNVNTIGPVVLSREDTNGNLLSWKLLFPVNPTFDINLPYFIQWDEGYEKRMNRLEKEGYFSKPIGKITAITINSVQAEETSAFWASIFERNMEKIHDKLFVLQFDDFSIHFQKNTLLPSGISKVHIENIMDTIEDIKLAGATYSFK